MLPSTLEKQTDLSNHVRCILKIDAVCLSFRTVYVGTEKPGTAPDCRSVSYRKHQAILPPHLPLPPVILIGPMIIVQ